MTSISRIPARPSSKRSSLTKSSSSPSPPPPPPSLPDDADMAYTSSDEDDPPPHSLPSTPLPDHHHHRSAPKRVTRSSSPPLPTPSSSSSPSLSSYDPSLLTTVTSLQSQLQQKDEELVQLSEALLLLNSSSASPPSPPSTASTSSLIKDLMKKQRELNLTLTRERQQHSIAIQQLKSTLSSPIPSTPPPPPSHLLPQLQAEVTSLTARLNTSRQLSTQLKTKVEKLVGVLQREVGDPSLVSSLIKEGEEGKEVKEGDTIWQGRAERVEELEKQVRALQRKVREQKEPTFLPPSLPPPSPSPVDQAMREVSEWKDKARVSRARVKVLEGEVAAMKEKVRVLLGKSEGDDEVIDRLREEVVRMRKEGEREGKERERGEGEVREEQLRSEVDKWKGVAKDVRRTWKEGREGMDKEWTVYRQAMEGMVSELQSKLDELDRERVEWRKASEEREKEKSTSKAGSKKKNPSEDVQGEKISDVKRRLLEMVGERELIRESYAAMLARRDEEISQWKAVKDRQAEMEKERWERVEGRVDEMCRL